MTLVGFKSILTLVSIGFAGFFLSVVLPPLIAQPDLVGAFAAGFVNPYASGYAMDAICCWIILAAWVAYEAKSRSVRFGWIAVLLGLAPGVATGMGVYLLMRFWQRAE